MPKPILVLQMQRMGDLILSFPLFLWLQRQYPNTPIWAVAEEKFYKQLMPISPQVVYIPWDGYRHVLKRKFSLVLNLSHRTKAAWLAGQVKSEEVIGPFEDKRGALRINGNWQLYRASLVHNNRYNRFHWADLNALDVIPRSVIAGTKWSPPRRFGTKENAVGLFIGASQKSKRPGVEFWSELMKALARRGLDPVILGGAAEKKLAVRIKKQFGFKAPDLSGRMDLAKFAVTGQTLQLVITPDTGPMHLAAWTGLRVLNLSVGPVHPWETGPYQPGNLILSTSRSCAHCWECRYADPKCRYDPDPGRVAALAADWVKKNNVARVMFPQNVLACTGRRYGLYNLVRRDKKKLRAGEALADFWQHYWLYWFAELGRDKFCVSAEILKNNFPQLFTVLYREVRRLLSEINFIVSKGDVPGIDFWKRSAPAFRPLRGYLQLYWQNQDYNARYISSSIAQVEDFIELLKEV
ncbi:MAG: glycosyltransferase family 9 protein [Thermodesulfobacteriota bacterium]